MAIASLGMRGSGSFTSVERPKNWRQQILLQFPNGDAPLTAILSKLREQPTDDPEFSWFEKGLPVQRGTIIGASSTLTVAPSNNSSFTSRGTAPGADAALTIAPDGGSAATVSDVSIFKPGHVLYNQTGDEVYLVKKVDRVNNFIIVQTSVGMASGTSLTDITGNTSTGNTAVIIGSGFPEGAAIGTAIAYQPAKYRNFTQIFRTPLWVTRTARKTRLRWDATGPYYEAKREALQIHAVEMERGFFFGERSENTAIGNPDAPLDITGSGTPLRTTRGILRWLPAITTTSTSIHTDISSLNGGAITEAILDGFCEEAFRFGSKEKVGFVGSTALNCLTQLAKNKSTIEVVPQDQVYGMHMVKYLTPFGSLMLVNHPLLSHDPVFRKDLFVVDVDKLTYRYITDTTFLENRQNPGDDASKDEFLTEAGLELHFSGAATDSDSPNSIATPAAHGRLKGISSYGG